MIILDRNPNEQASVDSKVLEAEGQSELAPSGSPTPTPTPAPPPYFSQPPNTGLNHQTVIVSYPGPTNSRQESALKRFLKAFACALLVIALMRMLVWSVDLLSFPGRREPHEWTSNHNEVCPEFLTQSVSFHSNLSVSSRNSDADLEPFIPIVLTQSQIRFHDASCQFNILHMPLQIPDRNQPNQALNWHFRVTTSFS
jgi:hypothetical protein